MWFCTVSTTFRATARISSCDSVWVFLLSICWKICAPKTAYKMRDKMRKTWENKRQNSLAHLLFGSAFRSSSTSKDISQSFREALMAEETSLSSHGSVVRSRMDTTPLQKQTTDLNCLFNFMFKLKPHWRHSYTLSWEVHCESIGSDRCRCVKF